MSGTVVLYGAPPPYYPPDIIPNPMPVPRPGPTIPDPVSAISKTIRVTTRVDENGALKLKVYVDGAFVSEATSENGSTITLEVVV